MAAQLAGFDAVTGNTREKQAWYWGYWLKYLKTIKLANDPSPMLLVQFLPLPKALDHQQI